MEIDSYEMFHIGSKLIPATDFNSFKNKLKNRLEKINGYSIVTSPQQENINLLRMPIETVAFKDTVRVELNMITSALNVVGTEVESVLEVFDNVLYNLSLDIELDNSIIFYEIISTVIIKVDDNPLDVLNKKLTLDPSSFIITDVNDWKVNGIRIGGGNESLNSFFSIFIEPTPTAPSSKFRLKLQYQTREKERINKFSEELNSNIKKLINNLM